MLPDPLNTRNYTITMQSIKIRIY